MRVAHGVLLLLFLLSLRLPPLFTEAHPEWRYRELNALIGLMAERPDCTRGRECHGRECEGREVLGALILRHNECHEAVLLRGCTVLSSHVSMSRRHEATDAHWLSLMS